MSWLFNILTFFKPLDTDPEAPLNPDPVPFVILKFSYPEFVCYILFNFLDVFLVLLLFIVGSGSEQKGSDPYPQLCSPA